jgi:hypothetical protein
VHAVTVLRFAVAIVLNGLAFIVWDVGTRPPLVLARDVGRGLRRPNAVARGFVRFVLGCALLLLAAIVARPAIPTVRAFTLLETGMLIAALLVENLIGPDVRRRLRRAFYA